MLTSCSSYINVAGKQDLHDHLLGYWVQDQKGDNNSLRYKKADGFELNQRGFLFKDSNVIEEYSEFGCQMPYPNFKVFRAKWKLKNKHTIVIYDRFPGEKPKEIKVVKFTGRVMRFVWE